MIQIQISIFGIWILNFNGGLVRGVTWFFYTEIKYLSGKLEKISEEDEKYLVSIIERACEKNEFDYLNAPPSVDDQVEDFIKEFFDEEDKPLEKRDFLEEFFAELDEEDKDADKKE